MYSIHREVILEMTFKLFIIIGSAILFSPCSGQTENEEIVIITGRPEKSEN